MNFSLHFLSSSKLVVGNSPKASNPIIFFAADLFNNSLKVANRTKEAPLNTPHSTIAPGISTVNLYNS